MHHSLKEWKKELDEALRTTYYHPTCDFCHNELIMSEDEIEVILFEPKKITENVIVMDRNNDGKICGSHEEPRERTVSSNPDKDIFKLKCPVCGHICEISRKEMRELRCSYYGDNNKRFELDDVETQRAKDFIAKHNHSAEFHAQGKLAFSTLGQQFTYEIIPGGLGNSVIIKCNHCGEIEDITNIDNW